MKRSFMGKADTTATSEKQPRKSFGSTTKDSSPLNENDGSVTILDHNNTLRERNSDVEASPDLPSLNDSAVNNDPAAENVILKKRNTELEEENSKLKDDLEFLEKRHGDVIKIAGSEKNIIREVYTEKKQYFKRAIYAEERIDQLQATLTKSREMVKTKDNQRIEIQHQLNHAVEQVAAEKTAKEKALKENEELQTELKNLQSVISSKNDIILRINNSGGQQQQSPCQSSSKSSDTVPTIAELQQTLSLKEKAIQSLQKRLAESYEVQENLKDEKREAISEKENFEKRYEELQKVAKTYKEKVTKLEDQLEAAQEKLGQFQNDVDQENYETTCENETLKDKVEELKKTIKEKNQQIAQLQGEHSVGQIMDLEEKNEEIEKGKAEIKVLQGKLAHAEKELIDMLAEYNDMKAQRDKEKADTVKEIADLKEEFELAKDRIEDLYDVNSELRAEKEMIEKDLDLSRQNEQQRTTQLSDEVLRHQQAVEKYEDILKRTKTNMEKIHSAKEQAITRAADASTKAAQAEAKFLECQIQLTKESEGRQELEGQLKNVKEKLGAEISAKEQAIKKNGELEGHNSQILAELLDAQKQELECQKKIGEMSTQFENDRKTATRKYEMLEIDNKALTSSNEKLQANIDASKKEFQEKGAKLQEFVQNLFCKE